MLFLPSIVPSLYDYIISLRIQTKPIEIRLTPKRLKKINVGLDLLPNKKAILNQIFKNRKTVFTQDFSYFRRIRPEVAPL